MRRRRVSSGRKCCPKMMTQILISTLRRQSPFYFPLPIVKLKKSLMKHRRMTTRNGVGKPALNWKSSISTPFGMEKLRMTLSMVTECTMKMKKSIAMSLTCQRNQQIKWRWP